MFLNRDDLTLQHMEDRHQRPRWIIYGILAIVILAPIAAWLVRKHGAPAQQQPGTPSLETPAAQQPLPAAKPAAPASAPIAKTSEKDREPQQKQAVHPAATPIQTARDQKPQPSKPALPAATSTGSGHPSIAQFRSLVAEHRNEEARSAGYQILASSKDAAVVAELEQLLGALNMTMLFSPAPMPEKTEYTIVKGDSLDRIAKKHGATIDMLRAGNNINGDRINTGDRLRVFTGTCALKISKSKNDMVLMVNDRFFKRYRVGTGKYGKTPTGSYIIEVKIKDPPWTRPADKKIIPFGDPENVLGTRWMSIQAIEGTAPVDGYGIHGTIEPDTVGKQSSDGCIRLVNADVEELYSIVTEGTRVTITE